jgi:hypothetical protein
MLKTLKKEPNGQKNGQDLLIHGENPKKWRLGARIPEFGA